MNQIPASSTPGTDSIEVALDDLPLDAPIRLEDGGAGVVVVRTNTGVFALDDVCPHARYRLSDGDVSDGSIECPGHGWRFALADGQCTTVPAYCALVRAVTVSAGRVRIAGRYLPTSSSEAGHACAQARP
jgi:nitrite reductase/ring-hydroxylating ferredoxin subunit